MYLNVGHYDGNYEAQAHRVATLKVKRLQKTRSTDLAALLRVLEGFKLLTPTTAFCAPASLYPERQVLSHQVQYVLGALFHEVNDTYREDNTFAQTLEAMFVVYNLLTARVYAIAYGRYAQEHADRTTTPYPAFVPSRFLSAPDLIPALRRVETLDWIDDVVDLFHRALQRDPLQESFRLSAGKLVGRILSTHVGEQLVSGQTQQQFFAGLSRPASSAYSALLYRAIGHRHDLSDADVRNALTVANASVTPIVGAQYQGGLVRDLFPRGPIGVNKIAYESLNAIVREAIANPYKIWTSLNGLCIQCGKQSTYACSHCGKVYYCSEACETAHWSKSHRISCALYALQ